MLKRFFLPIFLISSAAFAAPSPFEGFYGGAGVDAQRIKIRTKGTVFVNGAAAYQGKTSKQETTFAPTLYTGYGQTMMDKFYYGTEFKVGVSGKKFGYPLKNSTVRMNYKSLATYQPSVRAGFYASDTMLVYVKAGLDMNQVEAKSNGVVKKTVFYNLAPTIGVEKFITEKTILRLEAAYTFRFQGDDKLKAQGVNATHLKTHHKAPSILLGVSYKLSGPAPMSNTTPNAPAPSPMPAPPTAPSMPHPSMSGMGA